MLKYVIVCACMLCGCKTELADFPRNDARCEAACAKLAFIGCQEGNDAACLHVCIQRETYPYMQPLAECVLRENDVSKCNVRCSL